MCKEQDTAAVIYMTVNTSSFRLTASSSLS